MKTCVLVLSAPRSGSSCLTGCLQLCGVSLGKNVTTVTNHLNEKGYFENQEALGLHQAIIDQHGVHMFQSAVPEQIDSEQVRERLGKMLGNQFSGLDLFAIKDPRILFMRTSYLDALREFGAQVKVIDLRRSPESSAASMQDGGWLRRGQKPLGAHAMYTVLLDAFVVADRLCVEFEELVREPRNTIQRACDFIGLQYNAEVETFVERKLVHR